MLHRTLITRSLGILELLVGIGAVVSGAALVAVPSGALLGMRPELLESTPFRTFLIPGVLLCAVVGTSTTLAGVLALLRKRSAPISALMAGGILVGWMAIQLALIGYRQPNQVLFLLFGLVILGTAAALMATAPKVETSGK